MQPSEQVKSTNRLTLAGIDTSLALTLENAGYQIVSAEASDQDLFQKTDIIVIGAAEWSDFAAIAEKPLPQRPLLILASDEPISAGDFADLETPNEPAWILRAIEKGLRLREETLSIAEAADETRVRLQQSEAQRSDQVRIVLEAEVLMNAIVRNVSHELRTPLLQVKSAVAMLADEIRQAGENEDLDTLVSFAENATSRLELHVRNITMLGGSLTASLAPTILREGIDQAIRSLRRNWQFRDQMDRIQIQIAPDVPAVMADRQGIGTVLELLLDNALKFSEGVVDILVEVETEDRVRIEIRDRGIGISPNQIETIFKPFYQANSDTNRPFGGCGVGLTLVKMILDRHDEKLTVLSTPGQGSSFIFYLNVANLDSYFG